MALCPVPTGVVGRFPRGWVLPWPVWAIASSCSETVPSPVRLQGPTFRGRLPPPCLFNFLFWPQAVSALLTSGEVGSQQSRGGTSLVRTPPSGSELRPWCCVPTSTTHPSPDPSPGACLPWGLPCLSFRVHSYKQTTFILWGLDLRQRVYTVRVTIGNR